MKNVIVVILIMSLLLAYFSVYASTPTNVKLEMNQVTREVHVSGSVKDGVQGKRITLFVIKPGAAFTGIDDESYPFEASVSHIAQTSTIMGNNSVTFEFPVFTLNSDAPTGEYKLRISGDGIDTIDKTFRYNTADEMKISINQLDNASEDTVNSVIRTNIPVLGADLEIYDQLRDASKLLVQEAILKGDFSIGGSQQQEDIFLAAEKLIKIYNENVCVGMINDATSALDVEEVINAYNNVLVLNTQSFYSQFSSNSKTVLKNKIADATFSDLSELRIFFQNQVCLEAIRVLQWGKMQQVLDELSGIDYLVFDQLNTTYKDYVYKSLAGKSFTNVNELNDEFVNLSKEARSKQNSGDRGESGTPKNGSNKMSINVPTDFNTTMSNSDEVTEPAKGRFMDLESVSWAVESINALADKGIINGDQNGKFNPNDKITRAEFLKILLSGFDLVDENAQTSFTDAVSGEWYYKYIASAQKSGVINGISTDVFGVNEMITRQDMSTVIYRLIISQELSLPETTQKIEFEDDSEIKGYAKTAVYAMQQAGIINGVGGNRFDPGAQATRAEAAKIIYTLLKAVNKL